MRLSDIPDGSAVLIDANIFVYHFVGGPPAAECDALLERVESGTVAASRTGVVGHVDVEDTAPPDVRSRTRRRAA